MPSQLSSSEVATYGLDPPTPPPTRSLPASQSHHQVKFSPAQPHLVSVQMFSQVSTLLIQPKKKKSPGLGDRRIAPKSSSQMPLSSVPALTESNIDLSLSCLFPFDSAQLLRKP